MNVQHRIVYRNFTIFLVENFSINAMKICGFTENFLITKLGEISILNAVQELNFSKLACLQPETVLEIELHSFFSLLFSRVVERIF